MTTTIITTAGKQAIAEAIANKTTLKIARIAVGDGGGATYTPTVSQTALKGQKWSGELNRKVINPENQKQIIFEGLIASGIGGFFIREVGLFDDNNVLIAVSDFPESFKAAADQYELYIRMILEVSNTDVTNIIVNNDLVYATKEFVEKFVNSSGIAEELAAHQRDIEKKVDKVTGKGLSTNDYTTVEKNKLAGIATGANNYVHPSTHPATMITEDATHRWTTDAEKLSWNGKYTKPTTGVPEADLEQSVKDKLNKQTITGNAATASKLQNARKINGVSFDGSADVSIGNLVPVQINAATNLNDLQTAGMYYTNSNTTVGTLSNCPTVYAFSLLIEKHAGTKQTLTEHRPSNSKTFVRNYYSGTWGEWIEQETVIGSQNKVDSKMAVHKTEVAPHQYGGKMEWRYNSTTNSLDLVVL